MKYGTKRVHSVLAKGTGVLVYIAYNIGLVKSVLTAASNLVLTSFQGSGSELTCADTL